MSAQHILDHASNIYVAVTLSPGSPAYTHPELLASHPAVAYVGHVGELQDVRLLSVPKERWGNAQADILAKLNGINGVKGVEVQQPPRTRVKRGDEF